MLMNVFSVIGKAVGIFGAASGANEIANNWFGVDPSYEENLKAGFEEMIGWPTSIILNLFKWIKK